MATVVRVALLGITICLIQHMLSDSRTRMGLNSIGTIIALAGAA